MKTSINFTNYFESKKKPKNIFEKNQLNEELKCRVCGDQAHGYNFDQISCESCKAFFRRNAFRNLSDLKCRYFGYCQITVQSRRSCTFCRLKKCFDVKMKKEWIRIDHQRNFNQLKRLSNSHQFSTIQRKKRSIYPINMNYLSTDELSLIESISQTYDFHALNNNQLITIYSLNSLTLIDFLNNEEKVYKNLIEFFKSIQQFRQIDIEDQILLIKCNITHLVHIHHVLKDNFIENSRISFQMSQWINKQFHENMSKNRLKLNYFHQHPIILKISLIIFIFSINLSRLSSKQFNCQLINSNKIFENQNYFLNLLIKYLNRIYNENDSNKAIQILVFQYLQYQLLMDQMELFIQKHLTHQHFLPLTKSVLRLT